MTSSATPAPIAHPGCAPRSPRRPVGSACPVVMAAGMGAMVLVMG